MAKLKPESLEQQLAQAEKEANAANKKANALRDKLEKQKEAYKPKPIWQTVTTLLAVYKKIGCDPKKDVLKIDKFDKEELAVVEGVIERIRIAKALRNGPALGRGVRRWFPYSILSSAGAGLVFDSSTYDDDCAILSSSARLSFQDKETSDAYFKNFKKTEEKIIGL